MNKYNIFEYKEIINLLWSQYNEFTASWDKNNSLNMNRKTVYDIYSMDENYVKDDFYQLLKRYYDNSNSFMIKQKINFKLITDKNIRSRLKSTDSLMDKIDRKMLEDNGKYPINKVANDIIGYRIIDSDYELENKEKLIQILEEEKSKKKIRIVERDMKGYKATHIYFRGQNNYCFPIELQIWDAKYKKENRKSHIYHKQGYIDNIDDFDDF